jgi:hypothetical protein
VCSVITGIIEGFLTSPHTDAHQKDLLTSRFVEQVLSIDNIAGSSPKLLSQLHRVLMNLVNIDTHILQSLSQSPLVVRNLLDLAFLQPDSLVSRSTGIYCQYSRFIFLMWRL